MLKQRIVTALVLLLFVLLALFVAPPLVWQAVVVGVAAIAAWEWTQFAKLKHFGQRFGFVCITILSSVCLLYFDLYTILLGLAFLQLMIVVFAVSRFQTTQGQPLFHQAWLNLLIGCLFIVSFVGALVWLRDVQGINMLLVSLTMIWLVDTGAYFAGRRFGRHKLAMYVSPGKTWEGVAGGVLLAGFAAVVIWFVADIHYQPGLLAFVLGLSLIAGLSVYGDLFESLMKRQVGLKDSGKILPGHGGVLDRIDSLLLALPLFWVFWSFA
jgi:phosphatidate cytidylyltransferase